MKHHQVDFLADFQGMKKIVEFRQGDDGHPLV